jgi:hypothetical protein
VTRFCEFSSAGWTFTFGSFFENYRSSSHFRLFSPVKAMH